MYKCPEVCVYVYGRFIFGHEIVTIGRVAVGRKKRKRKTGVSIGSAAPVMPV